MRCFYVLSSWRSGQLGQLALQEAEQPAGQDPLQASADLLVTLALGASAGYIAAGGGVLAQAGQRDHVQGAVELAVPSTVQTSHVLVSQAAMLLRWPQARCSL